LMASVEYARFLRLLRVLLLMFLFQKLTAELSEVRPA